MPFISGLSWLGVEQMLTVPSAFLQSHAQPEPKRPTPAAANFSLKASSEPKAVLIAAASSALGAPPLPAGAIHFQNIE